MENWKRYIPEGAKDLIFEECSKKVEIQNILRQTYIDAGFLEISSPLLEFYDVFNYDKTIFKQENMYKLFDKQGRMMVLRPDMTTPAVRISATKLKRAPHPLKLCYTENIYRENENLNGKDMEIAQSGIEILGAESIKADAEIVTTAIRALLKCGLKEFKIELGQINFFKSIIKETEMDDEKEKLLKYYVENKNFTALENFIEENGCCINKKDRCLFREISKLFGGIEILDRAASMTDNSGALESINNVRELYNAVCDAGYKNYISVDLGMIQNIDYYTGIIFRGYAQGVGDSILSGGRYDNLAKQFGDDECATGLAIDVDSIMKAIDSVDEYGIHKKKIFIYYKKENYAKAYAKAEELRKKDAIVEMSIFDNESEARKYCDLKQMDEFITI
ncbi:ATP phosphoribosyltransferase regulatory subunit [Clostridium tyrobutyricum]|uniref:ATP phosphoribosyltransferase regulatory subunit n=1 Tax=Clostridium tyrobutyricum TaxID=1519 RepID=UPI001C3945D5|nr:ATP phosphoribosyltransferase regulatory subunit [Clostridium tyrobutyricum]MBV4450668.1 ATP phosphoribosyltransferase regulatory subunit [Clostridium tyrobutyricum]MCH4201190.1 ATP phosphoribosyltransferase regulatory subunit [Clostridium tyrobutyricum]MCH4238615.1 ATP phosphoribosyltransferase regulatory subunit [Clostridium tyrobutyricum]MCH4257609.1 ATP phosphoribosyltransferase regulatory subunit [Clostridium tyrobutyricum]MCI1238121.1 ATP phosphoribosyltransferase regulatory subunit [